MKTISALPDMESQSTNSAYAAGYLAGDRDGHKRGWFQGVKAAQADDLTFARIVEAEIHHRELRGEHARDFIHRLVESLEAEAHRNEWDRSVRAERTAA